MEKTVDIVARVLELLVEEFQRPTKMNPSVCESPIESIFFEEFRKVGHAKVLVRQQHDVQTDIGDFRLDFMLECLAGGPRIGVECDGRDFHSPDRDKKRDAAIIRAGYVDKIYRLRGRDICYHIFELVDLLGRCEPWILSERGKVNLAARTNPESLREDYFGRYGLAFPFAAIRIYSQLDDDSYTDQDAADIVPRRPIVICWTELQRGGQNASGRLPESTQSDIIADACPFAPIAPEL